MESRLASKTELKEVKDSVDSLNRKFDVQQERLDRHGIQLEKHEKEIKKLQVAIA